MNFQNPHFPPAWACAWGQDEYGLWASFALAEVEQVMRWIVPGVFVMGEGSDAHTVELTEGYWLADTACTQALWEKVMGENPSRFRAPDNPVEKVSWDDVKGFLAKLSALSPGLSFSLPTEAQWEYACRAGTTTAFSFGETITTDQANYNGEDRYEADVKGENRQKTISVKALPANSWGLYQMHGNVWEWCSDWYGEYETASQQPLQNPSGVADGLYRVCRGGSWIGNGNGLRSALRGLRPPDFRFNILGFRLALGQAPVQR